VEKPEKVVGRGGAIVRATIDCSSKEVLNLIEELVVFRLIN